MYICGSKNLVKNPKIGVMKERINQVMKMKSVNAAELADLMQIKRPSLSHIMTGRNNPSLDFVMKLKETFPELNLEWLLYGRGPMTQLSESLGAKTSNKPQQPLLFDEAEPKQDSRSFQVADGPKMADLFSQETTSTPTPEDERVIPETINMVQAERKEVRIQEEREPLVKKTGRKPVRMILVYDDETFSIYDYQRN